MPTFKEQIEELVKDCKVLNEESDTSDFELANIDISLSKSIDNTTSKI